MLSLIWNNTFLLAILKIFLFARKGLRYYICICKKISQWNFCENGKCIIIKMWEKCYSVLFRKNTIYLGNPCKYKNHKKKKKTCIKNI